MSYRLRKANVEDAKLIFDWANEPDVRANSFNPELIEWDNHIKWFRNKLDSVGCIILILEEHDHPIGQIRFDLNDEAQWEVDYSVGSEFRGQGIGKRIIKEGMSHLHQNKYHEPIVAKVKRSNIPSLKVFRKLGFKEQLNQDVFVFRFENTKAL